MFTRLESRGWRVVRTVLEFPLSTLAPVLYLSHPSILIRGIDEETLALIHLLVRAFLAGGLRAGNADGFAATQRHADANRGGDGDAHASALTDLRADNDKGAKQGTL